MSSSTEALSLAGDIFVVCLILSVGIACGRMSNQINQASSKVINQNTIEYLEADIASLMSESHTGASVKQAINKYRRKMRIEIITQKSSIANEDPMIIDATTSLAPLSDKENNYFIKNNGVFTCTATQDSNGNYITLTFTQKGAAEHNNVEDIGNDVSAAHDRLATIAGGDSTMTWNEIVSAISQESTSSGSAKSQMVKEINKCYQNDVLSDSSTWPEVANRLESTLSNCNDALSSAMNANSLSYNQFQLNYQESRELPSGLPRVMIAQNTKNVSIYVWSNSGGWLTANPGIDINGSTVTNNVSNTTMLLTLYY